MSKSRTKKGLAQTSAGKALELAFVPPSDFDLHLFNEGTHVRIYERFGAHLTFQNEAPGAHFAVWAPNAERVSVVGDFNGWNPGANPLRPSGPSGVWQGFIAGPRQGALYKYHITSRHHGYTVEKADPLGFLHERAPHNASILWDLEYDWKDGDWMAGRAAPASWSARSGRHRSHSSSP